MSDVSDRDRKLTLWTQCIVCTFQHSDVRSDLRVRAVLRLSVGLESFSQRFSHRKGSATLDSATRTGCLCAELSSNILDAPHGLRHGRSVNGAARCDTRAHMPFDPADLDAIGNAPRHEPAAAPTLRTIALED